MVEIVTHKIKITNKNKSFKRSVILLNAHEFCSYSLSSANILFIKNHVDIEVNNGAITYHNFLQELTERPFKITDIIFTSNKARPLRQITLKHKAIDAERSITFAMNVNYSQIAQPKPEIIDGHFAMAFDVWADEEIILELQGHQLSQQAAQMIDAMYKPLLKQ